MDPIRTIRSRIAVLAVDNVDTDQIIPARFLKVISKAGLGQHLFADWRSRPGFSLEKGAQVLVAGANFGCGSSREHAPWALVDFGFRAVVSTSFADIFRNNALKNGLLPVAVSREFHAALVAAPAEVEIDLEAQTVSSGGRTEKFPIDGFARHCLLHGVDELGFLLSQESAIASYESVDRHSAR